MNNRRMECGRGKGSADLAINGMCTFAVTRWIWITGPKSRVWNTGAISTACPTTGKRKPAISGLTTTTAAMAR